MLETNPDYQKLEQETIDKVISGDRDSRDRRSRRSDKGHSMD
jgi:hypothetical protein